MSGSFLYQFNALAGGFFLLCTFGMVATRQVQGCLRFFVLQSVFLAASAFVLGLRPLSWDLLAIAAINIVNKPILIPWLLRRMIPEEVHTRREITQVLNIPAALLIALGIAVYSGARWAGFRNDPGQYSEMMPGTIPR